VWQPSRSSGATTRGRGGDEIWRAELGRGVVGAEGTEEAAATLDARMGRRGKEAQQGTQVLLEYRRRRRGTPGSAAAAPPPEMLRHRA